MPYGNENFRHLLYQAVEANSKRKKKASARNKIKITETIKHIHDDVHNWYHLT